MIGNCPDLPQFSQGKPPCIPEFSTSALFIALVALVVVAIKRRSK